MGTVLIPRKLVDSSTAWVTWFSSISGIGGVVAIAVAYELACDVACIARFCACNAVVRSQTTIGIVAETARSLAEPVHEDDRAARLPANSSAWVSKKTASASHPAAAWSIGTSPAPAINRAVLSSGGIPCQIIATICGSVGIDVCLRRTWLQG